ASRLPALPPKRPTRKPEPNAAMANANALSTAQTTPGLASAFAANVSGSQNTKTPIAPMPDQCHGGRSPSSGGRSPPSSHRTRPFLSGCAALIGRASVGFAPELARVVLLAGEAALLLDEAAIGARHARVLREGVHHPERCLGVVGRAVGALVLDAEALRHL